MGCTFNDIHVTVEILTLILTISLRSNPLELLFKLGFRMKQHAIVSITILGASKYMFIACEVVHLMNHYIKCCGNTNHTQKMLELASE